MTRAAFIVPRAAALLLAAALFAPASPLAAQERRLPSDSSDHPRTAEPRVSAPRSDSSPPPATRAPSTPAPPRTAEPSGRDRDGDPRRQPPARNPDGSARDDDRGRRDGRWYPGGPSYYRGYYGYPGYYGYYPWGGFLWSDFWFGWYGYPRIGVGYRGSSYGYPDGYRQYGALDLDVAPGRTEVYVDGEYLGKVDAYDGFPRYLWLERGTYDVAFYLDGYRTMARQMTVRPGAVVGVDFRMEPGESVRPEALVSRTHERRDSRERFERERRDRLEREEQGDRSWRERVEEERERRRAEAGPEDGRELDRFREDRDREFREDREFRDMDRARVLLRIEPGDASVYVDGRFAGTGADLAGGIPLEPGEHRIAVVRPGHQGRDMELAVEPGDQIELDIQLQRLQEPEEDAPF